LEPTAVKSAKKVNPVKKRIDEIGKQMSKLADLYSVEGMDFAELSSKIDKLHKEKETLSKKLRVEEDVTKSSLPENIDEFREILKNMGNLWDLSDQDQKRYLLSLLVRGIYIDSYDLEFDWTFLPKSYNHI
jgi:site-specific DNA recombinase